MPFPAVSVKIGVDHPVKVCLVLVATEVVSPGRITDQSGSSTETPSATSGAGAFIKVPSSFLPVLRSIVTFWPDIMIVQTKNKNNSFSFIIKCFYKYNNIELFNVSETNLQIKNKKTNFINKKK